MVAEYAEEGKWVGRGTANWWIDEVGPPTHPWSLVFTVFNNRQGVMITTSTEIGFFVASIIKYGNKMQYVKAISGFPR